MGPWGGFAVVVRGAGALQGVVSGGPGAGRRTRVLGQGPTAEVLRCLRVEVAGQMLVTECYRKGFIFLAYHTTTG